MRVGSRELGGGRRNREPESGRAGETGNRREGEKNHRFTGSPIHRFLAVFLLFTIHCSLFTASHAAPLTDESTLNFKSGEAYQQKDTGSGLVASFAKLFAGLAVVLGVMLVVYRIAKERLAGAGAITGKGRLINVVATHYLAPKKAVMVIEVAGEHLVVGVGEEINLLARLEDAELGVGSRESGVRSQESGFSDVLKMAAAKESSLSVIDSIKESLFRLKGKR